MFSLEVYKEIAPREIVLPTLRDDGKNKGDFYGVETLTQNKFARNYGGYPRSDIALINEQSNIMVAKQMLEELPNFASSSNPNANKSDVEIMKGVQSKYMQSPSEFIPYIEKEIAKRDERLAAAAAYKAEQEAANKAVQDAANKAVQDAAQNGFKEREQDAINNA